MQQNATAALGELTALPRTTSWFEGGGASRRGRGGKERKRKKGRKEGEGRIGKIDSDAPLEKGCRLAKGSIFT